MVVIGQTVEAQTDGGDRAEVETRQIVKAQQAVKTGQVVERRRSGRSWSRGRSSRYAEVDTQKMVETRRTRAVAL
jgi:hypothetical protein